MTELNKVPTTNHKLLPIEHYYPIVETTTNVFCGSLSRKKVILNMAELKLDLYQEGMVALLECYNKYNSDKKVVFVTYALHRIKGKMLDYLRSLDTMSRTSRSKFKKIDIEFKQNHISLEEKNNKLHDISNMLTVEFQSLEAAPGDSSTCGPAIEDPQATWNEFEQVEREQTLEKIMKNAVGLSKNEQYVIDGYYFKDKSFKDIACELKLIQSRVSQIHTSAITKLRKTGNYA